MSDKKGWGSTVLGWFVVRPEDDATAASVADAAAYAPADPAAGAEPYGADQPVVPVTPMSNPPPAPGGKVDFGAVYGAAGVDGDQQERVEKAAALLRSLPAETDPAVKKQIVEASLKAFGVPIDKIIEAGVEEIQALEAYIRAGAADTAEAALRVAGRASRSSRRRSRRIKQVMDAAGAGAGAR